MFAGFCGGYSVRAEVVLTDAEWSVLRSEWSRLEARTNERQALIAELASTSDGLKQSNGALKLELAQLKALQNEQRQSLQMTEQALNEAEKSFEQWKKDELKKRTSLEHRKRVWQIIAIAAVIAAAVK